MTNADKYKITDEQADKMSDEFAEWHQNNSDVRGYGVALYRFLQEQAKPTLTEDEKVILRQLSKWFIVIGKTEHGCIMVQDKCQGNEKHFGVTFDLLFAELFKWIQPRRRIQY